MVLVAFALMKVVPPSAQIRSSKGLNEKGDQDLTGEALACSPPSQLSYKKPLTIHPDSNK